MAMLTIGLATIDLCIKYLVKAWHKNVSHPKEIKEETSTEKV